MTLVDLSRAQGPGLPRRLAIMLYDLLLLAAVLMVTTALWTLPYQALVGTPLYQSAAFPLFQLCLLLIIVGYYVYFWSHGRQTLGMRAWRTRLYRADGADLNARDALRRFGLAALTLPPLGIGLWWMLFARDRLAWYDRLSGTRPILLARPDARSTDMGRRA